MIAVMVGRAPFIKLMEQASLVQYDHVLSVYPLESLVSHTMNL